MEEEFEFRRQLSFGTVFIFGFFFVSQIIKVTSKNDGVGRLKSGKINCSIFFLTKADNKN